MKGVADSGPLIHLTEIKALWLLSVFEVIYLPDAVWEETVRRGRVPSKEILRLGNIQNRRVPPSELNRFLNTYGLRELHIGETECLYLCEQLKVSVFLTDDLDARKEAKAIGLTPVGSLGIVVKAFQLGVISLLEAKKYLVELDETSSLFVTGVIVQQAIVQLHNDSNR